MTKKQIIKALENILNKLNDLQGEDIVQSNKDTIEDIEEAMNGVDNAIDSLQEPEELKRIDY